MLNLVPAVSVQASEGAEVIIFEGAGFGHGRGMSQYGAQARALADQTLEETLLAYYTDTPNTAISTLGEGPTPMLRNAFVSVQSDLTSQLDAELKPLPATVLTVSSGGGTATTMTLTRLRGLPEQDIELNVNDTIEIYDTTPTEGEADGCRASLVISGVPIEWGTGSCDFDITLHAAEGLPEEVITATNCRTANCTFGFGEALHIVDNASPARCDDEGCYPDYTRTGLIFAGFDMVVEATLDDYTRGIAEVPFGWESLALQAQAVASRTYASWHVANTQIARKGCFCDLYNDSTKQVYAGWLGSRTSWNEWDSAAQATNGVVLTHPSEPNGGFIFAEYSSSNGGMSEQGYDNSLQPRPYLAPIDDPFSLTEGNPYSSWRTTVPASTIEAALGWETGTLHLVEIETATASGRAITVRFTSTTGETTNPRSVSDWLDPVIKSTATCAKANGDPCAAPATPFPSDFFSLPALPPPAEGAATVGVQDPRTGIWTLRHTDGTTTDFYYGNPKDIPFIGDWNGNGTETVGLYRESTGFLFLRYTNDQGNGDVQIYYGNPDDLPVAGDWDGDGVETIGIYRPTQARFYLRNTNTQGNADVDMPFGNAGDVPIAGDWDGDGVDTVGVYRPSTKTLYLTNSVPDGEIAVQYFYEGAAPGDRVLAGDWNQDGVDTIGVFRPSNATFYLRDTFTQSSANIVISFGDSWMNPIAGYWGG